jgi:hypothetical protein
MSAKRLKGLLITAGINQRKEKKAMLGIVLN